MISRLPSDIYQHFCYYVDYKTLVSLASTCKFAVDLVRRFLKQEDQAILYRKYKILVKHFNKKKHIDTNTYFLFSPRSNNNYQYISLIMDNILQESDLFLHIDKSVKTADYLKRLIIKYYNNDKRLMEFHDNELYTLYHVNINKNYNNKTWISYNLYIKDPLKIIITPRYKKRDICYVWLDIKIKKKGIKVKNGNFNIRKLVKICTEELEELKENIIPYSYYKIYFTEIPELDIIYDFIMLMNIKNDSHKIHLIYDKKNHGFPP